MRRAALYALGALSLGAMGMMPFSCAPPEPIEGNEPPVARLVWPQIWKVTEPVPFDASQSEDPDGVLQELSMVFGDGTEEQTSADGRFEHLYVGPGTYELRLEVRDEHGTPAELLGEVILVERHDEPICDCDFPCLDDAACTDTGCFLAEAREGTGGGGTASDGGGPARPQVDGRLQCP